MDKDKRTAGFQERTIRGNKDMSHRRHFPLPPVLVILF